MVLMLRHIMTWFRGRWQGGRLSALRSAALGRARALVSDSLFLANRSVLLARDVGQTIRVAHRPEQKAQAGPGRETARTPRS
jgi:hypothetical protein